jgi:hypothetical protein
MGALVIALIASLFGLRFGGNGSKSTEQKSEEPAASVSASPPPVGEAPHKRFLANFFRTKPLLSPDDSCCDDDVLNRYKDQVSVLIASVPDPVDTPFGFWYDQLVESITRAVVDAGYTPAGHWTPWEQYRFGRAGLDGETKTAPAPLFEQYPGVLRFRKGRNPDQVLAVLLVGETPNSVRSAALVQALKLAWMIHPSLDRPIRLVAPFFTGAQLSLQDTLQAWGAPHTVKVWGINLTVKFKIISGSANGLTAPDSQAPFSLRATIIPSVMLRNAAVQFLTAGQVRRNQGISKLLNSERVALLVESNTGFGDFQTEAFRELDAGEPLPWIIRYPMHLSRVQAQYARERQEKEKRLGLIGPGLTQGVSNVPVRQNTDTIPPLDSVATPPLQDRSVDDITITIRREKVRYVGILATDPRDTVFLVERIKASCPEAFIFTTDMDFTYALPENRHIMRGVVISTTYPLYPPNQAWTNPKDHRRQTFQSQAGNGYYNAAAIHLAEPTRRLKRELLQEYSSPVFTPVDHEGKETPFQPPVWIITVGENGRFVTHGYYDNYNTTAAGEVTMATVSKPWSEETTVIHRPVLSTFLYGATLSVLVAVVVLWWLLREASRFGRSKDKEPLNWRELFRNWWAYNRDLFRGWLTCKTEPNDQKVIVYRNMALAAIAVALIVILETGLILAFDPAFGNGRLLTKVCLCAMTVIIALLLLTTWILQAQLVWQRFRTLSEELSGGAPLLVHGVLFAGPILLGVLLVWGCLTVDSAARVLFVERTVSVLTGYSILLPALLLAAGFLAMACCALSLNYHGKQFRIECPYPPEKDFTPDVSPVVKLCGAINDCDDKLHKELTDFAEFCRRRWKWLLTAVGVYLPAAGLLVAYRCHGIWEGPTWNGFFAVGFVVLAGLVLITLLWFLHGWKGLETILKKMALVPMVGAFDRLPRKTAELFGGYLWTRRPRSSHAVIPLHILRQLRQEVAACPVPPAKKSSLLLVQERDELLKKIDEQLNKESGPKADDDSADEEYPGIDFSKLSEVARALILHLRRYWPWHTVVDAFGEQGERAVVAEAQETDSAGKTHATYEMPAEAQMAEEFVAIQSIIFISQYFILLKWMALALVWGAFLLMLAATCYPFQPERLILYLLLMLLASACGAVLWVMVQVNKNEICSRIMRSAPNRFTPNWAFAWNVLQYFGPIVLITAAHLSGGLRTILEPLLDAIR